MSWLKHLIGEKKTSLIIAFFFTIAIYQARTNFNGDNKFDVITVIITIVTITIGFATAALAMFLGITDKPVILRIRKRNQVNSLVNGFKDLIYLGGAVIVLSIMMSIFNMNELKFSVFDCVIFPLGEIIIFIFIFSTILSLFYAYDLISLILIIFRQLLLEGE